jgi:hypothetical protein
VGVLFDYFRAPDASTAAAVLERLGGPRDPDAPLLDAVAGKGFEPEVMLRKLQSLLTGMPYDELPEGELLAVEGEDGPWIVQLSEELRDALADAQPSSALLGSTVPAVLLVQVWAPQVIVMPAFGAPAGTRWSQRHRRQRYCR